MTALTPPLTRRFAVMVYESMLLFGLLFVAGWLFDTLTQSRHALTLRHVRQLWLFVVLGLYFIYFWRKSGQTLAMKTWRVKLVSADGRPVSMKSALIRYLLAWMWFMPAAAVAYTRDIKGWPAMGLIAAGVALWAGTVLLDRNRQFLHDRIAGTRLILLPPQPAPAAAA